MLDNHYTILRSWKPIMDLEQGTFTLLLTSKLDYYPKAGPALVGRGTCLLTPRRAKEEEQRNGR